MKSKRNQKNTRKKYLINGVFFIFLTLVIAIGVSQLNTIREFFSRASGEPADFRVDTQAILGPMPRPWRYLAQGGEDHAWRLDSLIPQVKALNPEYIRLDHIYDFYDIVQGTPGSITFDFSKLDPVIDDILATGAKPYIALSYMPPAISSGDITDPPVRWEDWQLTIQKTIEHLSGTRKITDVYYEVWNEPDLFGDWKYYGERNYLNLYSYAVAGANQARGVSRFKIGGPGITALYKNWFDALAKHAIKNDLRLDFFSWHRYDRDIERYQQDMAEIRQWIQDYPQLEPTLEFHITEWGHDSEVDVGYDTTYGAAHLAAGAIEMIPTVQKAFIFEIQDGKDPEGKPLWGRWGLFGHKDFGSQSKPRYQALRMLDKISDQRLQITGKGSWVKALAAKNEAGYTELIMANFDPRGSHVESVPVTFENIQAGSYTLNTEYLGGRKQQQQIATTAAVLRAQVMMPVNSVAFIKLIKADQ
jgi:xylan 1,4-beta-xylosidase